MMTRRRALAEKINNEVSPLSPTKKRKVNRAAKKTTTEDEISKPLGNKRRKKNSNITESFNLGPSTSQATNFTHTNVNDIKENLPLHLIRADTEEADLKENNGNRVESKLIKKEAELDIDDDDIVELDVSRHVLEVVLSSDDDEDDESHPSGSKASISQTRTITSREEKIITIKSEESSPQATLTPKTKKKLVLDPSILTPPTKDLFLNAVKYYKCLKFLEQSDLDPQAKEFIPSPKVTKKVADTVSDCVVCLEPRETTFVNLPCRHAVTCGTCSDQLELHGKDCPVCRTPIESRFQIFN